MENTKKRGDKRGKDEVRGRAEQRREGRRNPGTERGRGGSAKDAVEKMRLRRNITCEFESSCNGDAALSSSSSSVNSSGRSFRVKGQETRMKTWTGGQRRSRLEEKTRECDKNNEERKERENQVHQIVERREEKDEGVGGGKGKREDNMGRGSL